VHRHLDIAERAWVGQIWAGGSAIIGRVAVAIGIEECIDLDVAIDDRLAGGWVDLIIARVAIVVSIVVGDPVGVQVAQVNKASRAARARLIADAAADLGDVQLSDDRAVTEGGGLNIAAAPLRTLLRGIVQPLEVEEDQANIDGCGKQKEDQRCRKRELDERLTRLGCRIATFHRLPLLGLAASNAVWILF
jgi:hypothetical protein